MEKEYQLIETIHQKTKMNHILKVYTDDDQSLISYDDTLQELPVYGRGDYSEEAIRLTYEDGTTLNQFLYTGHEIIQGVYEDGHTELPRSYPKENTCSTTLKVILIDTFREVSVECYYTIYEHLAVITRSMCITNNSQKAYTIEKCASLNVDFSESDYNLMSLDGAWARERHVQIKPLTTGVTTFGSTRGCSSATHNPYMALLKDNTDENQGVAIGFSLIYSGNFQALVDVNQYHRTRVQLGIHPNSFTWKLLRGESFKTPEAVMAYSDEGLNGLSHVQHTFIMNHIMPKDTRVKPQVLINNWEATYFDFNESVIVEIAREAKTLGVNLFVLDDGWFTGRNSDEAALGDWFVDSNKLPKRIAHLSDAIHSLDMDFGLRIEPEMINKNSQLYEKHPEWVVGHPSYSNSVGRHQYVLDYSNNDVVDYIYELISAIMREAKVDYIKWDMNRLISEPSSQTSIYGQGEFHHRYIIGVYELYRRLTTEFKAVTFESCASGGARFDLGMLCYSNQTWTSDNTDPAERLLIQSGTSYLYPVKTMGSHVSAVINHQTLRHTSLSYKSHVALFGTYGLELNPLELSTNEKELIKEEIAFFKKYQSLIHTGRFYRLETPSLST